MKPHLIINHFLLPLLNHHHPVAIIHHDHQMTSTNPERTIATSNWKSPQRRGCVRYKCGLFARGVIAGDDEWTLKSRLHSAQKN